MILLYYLQGAFYRFKFLLAFTIICAALTIAFFITTNVNEAHWKFGEQRTVEISSKYNSKLSATASVV